MADQICYEDVALRAELPALVRRPTIIDNVMLQACCWLWHRIHYDRDYAVEAGWDDPVVLGLLEANYLAHMLAGWMGEQGMLRSLSYQARKVCTVRDTLTCSGVVTAKRLEAGAGIVDCEVWINNQAGEPVMTGTATVSLPLRDAHVVA